MEKVEKEENEEKEAGLRAGGWRGGEWERPGVPVQPHHLTKKDYPTLPMKSIIFGFESLL